MSMPFNTLLTCLALCAAASGLSACASDPQSADTPRAEVIGDPPTGSNLPRRQRKVDPATPPEATE